MQICYLIGGFGKVQKVLLSHLNNNVTISVEGLYDKVQIIPRKKPDQWDRSMIDPTRLADVFDVFLKYLPKKVVTSVFSMHEEYPIGRPANYDGVQLIADRSITYIYGKSHYGLGSISQGIFRFLDMYLAKNSRVKSLLKLFELKFSGRILHRNYIGYSSTADDNQLWTKVDKKWLQSNKKAIHNRDHFINDIEFDREGRLITLMNMSSGEKMLLLRCISILESIDHNSLVIIEEPELHLDPVWNKQLVTLFRTFFSRYRCHIIIATHDFSLINAVPPSQVIKLDKGEVVSISQTFLASHEDLFSTLYGDEFRNNKIEDKLLSDLENKSLKELQEIFDEMGNSIYKYLVYKKILTLQSDVEGN
jgi:ABC-type lipoprotein export system ATPase subunit